MKATIRKATLEDATGIIELIAEHAAAGGETSPLTSSYLAQYLDSPASEILLAEAGGEVVGLLSWSVRPDLYHAADCCFIEELIVTQRQRDQGLGRALMAELFARLGDRDCAEVSLAVMQDNVGAIRFYRSLGLSEEALLLETHTPASVARLLKTVENSRP